jgi:hypothetical protein
MMSAVARAFDMMACELTKARSFERELRLGNHKPLDTDASRCVRRR